MNIDPMRESFHETSTNDRNYGLLILTVLVSIGIHFFLYEKMADLRFDAADVLPEQFKEMPVRKIVNFERLKQDPEKPLPEPKTGDPSAKPGVGVSSKELAEIISRPVVTFAAPPVSQAVLETAKVREVKVSEIAVEHSVWQPRQEIMKIQDRIARDDMVTIPRREIYAVERVSNAPDYAPEVDLSKNIDIPVVKHEPVMPVDTAGSVKDVPPAPVQAVAETVEIVEVPPESTLVRFGEKPSDITEFKPVDSRLMARTTVFKPAKPDGRKYFKLEIAPRDVAQLPPVPKDIVFVQDSSRSLSEQRLHFCREALVSSLDLIPQGDRFNIAEFRDKTTFCFPGGWVSPTAENKAAAKAFIEAMRAQGETDLFESLKSLMSLPRDPKRPLIVIAVTDGKATSGLTESTKIIGEFSKMNDNMSLYVVGTQPKANAYLLDMISYCNRGSQTIVRSGRWDIPKEIEKIIEECSRPVLGRVGVTTDTPSHSELFPLPSANLYAGKSLLYFGSCPEDVKSIVMQIRGEGGEAKCDCLFDLNLEADALPGGADLKEEWAKRRMYTLIGEYARNPTQALLYKMREHSAATGVPIPYANEL